MEFGVETRRDVWGRGWRVVRHHEDLMLASTINKQRPLWLILRWVNTLKYQAFATEMPMLVDTL